MSTLTGNDVRGLMEAYQAVYAPQELTEEQVWEEVEEWVNTLIEEGYDLSDYTWEEMFEDYIEEIYGTNLGGNTKTKPNKLDTAVGNVVKSITSSGADATPRTTGIYGQPTRKPPAPDGKVGPKIVGPKIVGPKVVGPRASQPPVKSTTAAPSKPAAPRPSGTTPASKPAPTPAGPTKPAIGTTAGGTKFERRAATGAELRAAQAARAAAKAAGNTKGAEEAAVKAGVEAGKSASKPTVVSRPSGFGSPTAPLAAKLSAATSTAAPEVKATNTIAAAPKPAPVSPRQAKLNMEMEYDAYDLVLEYLLSQGHADTLEEANYVMLEMDAEMIGDIVEVMTLPSVKAPPNPVPEITGDGSNPPSHGEYKRKYNPEVDEPKLPPTKKK